jgi:hypothetical protein
VGGLEIDEEPQHLIVNPERLRIGAVDLVDGDDRPKPQGQCFSGDEPSLRHGPLGRIHQDQHAVHHAQNPLDLAAEIGVAGRVHDVDLGPVPPHGGVLGENGDSPLALERIGIHHPFLYLLIGSERPRLPEHLINQSGLAVVHVGDDRQVTNQSALP